MATVRGFVRSIEVRADGWMEIVTIAVHADSAAHKTLIQSPDADLSQAHRRLAKLSVLRDALASTLPVEIAYTATDKQGDIIDDVTIYPTESIEGRRRTWWKVGIVIELMVSERGPENESSPWVDLPDVGA